MPVDFEKPAIQALRYLFSEYKKGPGVIHSINPIAKKYKIDPVVLGDYLMDNGWVRECWSYSGNVIACRITIQGIEKVDPVYVQDKMGNILGVLADAGHPKPLMEVLEFNIEEYSIASDIVNQLQKLGLVRIDNSERTLRVGLTDAGLKFHERRHNGLLTLVA